MKVGDLVKPRDEYISADATMPIGIIVERDYCDGGGHLEPETVFTVEWNVDCSPEWQDYELELVSENRQLGKKR